MIPAFWCVLVAGVLPLACAYVAKGAGVRAGNGPFDNHHPRAWLARQDGASARANAAQLNSWEALPLFAAGVVIAALQHVPVATIDLLAIAFVVARLAYIACYVADLAALRSLCWLVGFAASVGLFVAAAFGSLR